VDSTLLRLRVWLSLRCRAHTASGRSLEAVEPFPGLPGAKSSKEEEPSPDTITPIRLQEGCYPLWVSPRTPAHNKAGGLYGKSHLKQGQVTIGP
jgi:hypothetical protein